MAVIYETLRMVPVVRRYQLCSFLARLYQLTIQIPAIHKQSAYDTKFTARTSDGKDTREFRVPSGTNIVIEVPALHYNRKQGAFPT
jgi:hypothetical protein